MYYIVFHAQLTLTATVWHNFNVPSEANFSMSNGAVIGILNLGEVEVY